ncbi:hypothetical protein SAMN00808754_1535 [Thermanaeromonas toyohensis ToBE]|uniref:Fibronectin type-III domain-containing protein n=1 Tax=Thermanaeromonas toyohensis ToBE TaxID=698762 RepID=A0A1W1VUH8_9FIRM|nr:hypothetical protein [Thermanaeromonas toyohensis]SMB96544.1 hypothetical protein SAMN00808754_1535 [Thermanaeromonas toyohensis ToBE]
MTAQKIFLVLALAGLHFFFRAGPALAATWQYGITDADTPTTIDRAATTAVVDTTLHEIRLPKYNAHAASFWPDGGPDYVVMAPNKVLHFSFDGTWMVENPIVSITLPSNPLAVAAGWQYPDVVVALPDKLYHYSFTGTGMVENPALSVAGLAGAAAVGVREGEVAGLVGKSIKDFMFDGTGMVEVPYLEPSGLTNPIDFALMAGSYDVAVLDGNQVRYYNFTGSVLVENPALAITGLSSPVAIAAAGEKDLVVVDGKQVKHFSFDGSAFRYNAALSVTSGLNNPVCVAVRPGTFDRIIIDGDQVKYYSWDGTQLVYNPNMSVTVTGLSNLGSYAPSAVAVSQAKDPGNNVDYVRVRAYVSVPDKTSITFSLTADGSNWVKVWRVRGTPSGPVAEVTSDNGATWTAIGDSQAVSPASADTRLWAKLPAGRAVKWRADLATSDTGATPKIVAVGGVAVVWDTNAKPNPPVIDIQETCYTTTTPTLAWTFSDPDPGDVQSAYQLQIVRASDFQPVLDTGKVTSDSAEYRVPSSGVPHVPGPLWDSGDYRFKVRVKVWDQAGVESDWSAWADFCVIAFERPRVAGIASPPPGQVAPDPTNPSTHILITPGMTAAQLPKVKAGAKVTLLVDSVGPLDTVTAVFPYGAGHQATIGSGPAAVTVNGTNKTWQVEFWTDPSLEVTPEGTVVEMRLSGTGPEGSAALNAPDYADGVVVTIGTVYNDWFVVLQGRDTGI